MNKATAWTPVNPEELAPPLGPYAQGSHTADGWIYTAGLGAVDENKKTMGVGDVRAQTQEIFRQANAILAAAGGGLDDVVFAHVFLKDFADYSGMNEVYREEFDAAGGRYPPRYCIRADLVLSDMLVEIAFVAKVA